VDQKELGERIRQARERIHMSQEALAEVIKRDQKAISEYETGKRKLPAVELPTFSLALGVPVSYFFENEFRVDELDQLLLQEFHVLTTPDDRQAALQAVRLISEVVRRYSSISGK
jgi:transcriptional regulator with XRE-family HTH domain